MLNKIKTICRFIPIIVCIVLIFLYFITGKDLSADSVINFVGTENQFIAAIILILLFGVKSLSICFPLMILYISGGYLFPPTTAIIVNIIGTAVCLTLPYCIGKFSGAELVEKLKVKYPKVANFVEKQKKSEFFISFIFRAIRLFPTDVVSIYLGTLKFSYIPYIIAGILGEIPGIICITLIGNSITSPNSPMFIISASFALIMTITSLLIYLSYIKREAKKGTATITSDENSST